VAAAGLAGAILPLGIAAQLLDLPPRAQGAPSGSEIARRLADLDLAAREATILEEIQQGNVPGWLRELRPVDLAREVDGSSHTVRVWVTADYLAVGSDLDYFLIPLSPRTAQAIADRAGASLPTPPIVDAVWREAEVRLGPDSLPPGPDMITVPVFARHDRLVRTRRIRSGVPLGALVAGHKKDIVLSSRLSEQWGHVAIYGWHRPDGRPIQPLYTGHTDDWVDYSHGVRLVHRTVWIDGTPADLVDVLRDPRLAPLVSDEGPITEPRYPTDDPDERSPGAPTQSSLSASMGLTFDARQAGIQQAPSTTQASTAATTRYVRGSNVGTPTSWLAKNLVSRVAARSPKPKPRPASTAPSPRTRDQT
jgi:hypothetical protein